MYRQTQQRYEQQKPGYKGQEEGKFGSCWCYLVAHLVAQHFQVHPTQLNSSIPPTSYQVDASYQPQGTGYKLPAPVTTNSVPLVFSWWRTRWPKLGTLEHYQAEGGGRGNCCLIRGSIRTRIPENTFRDREPFFHILPIVWGEENSQFYSQELVLVVRC